MTAPIGPAVPTRAEFVSMGANRDALARVIARDVAAGFVPDALIVNGFSQMDGAVKTTRKILAACR